MPKNKNIKSILIIGSGPIVIGQACEFDYSGSQAAKSLKNEGYRVVLVNSNPATIMTDPEMADATYIEPLTPEFLKRDLPPPLLKVFETLTKSPSKENVFASPSKEFLNPFASTPVFVIQFSCVSLASSL